LYMNPFQCAADVSDVLDEIVARLASLLSPLSVVNETLMWDHRLPAWPALPIPGLLRAARISDHRHPLATTRLCSRPFYQHFIYCHATCWFPQCQGSKMLAGWLLFVCFFLWFFRFVVAHRGHMISSKVIRTLGSVFSVDDDQNFGGDPSSIDIIIQSSLC